MTDIVFAEDGVTQAVADLMNQYAQTFSQVFGVTDTAQAALNRLVLPRATVPPATPQLDLPGRVYYDESASERRVYYDHGDQWIPMLSIRQAIKQTRTTDLAIGTSATTVQTVPITTTGNSGVLAFAQAIYDVTKGPDAGGFWFDGMLQRSGVDLQFLSNIAYSDLTAHYLNQFLFMDWTPDLPAATYNYSYWLRRQPEPTTAANSAAFGGSGTFMILLEIG